VPQRKPNIILLVLDTQQARRMSMYGYEKDTTPVLGELAEKSTVFDRAIAAAPWTVPSHASMFTGLYGTVHQTRQTYGSLPESIPSIAELLQQNGYDTVGFCNNPLVGLLDTSLDRGFDRFYNYSGSIPDIPELGDPDALQKFQLSANKMLQRVMNPIEKLAGSNALFLRFAMNPWFVPIWTGIGNYKGNTRQSTSDATDYIKFHTTTHSDRPFFMFVNLMETHMPYYPPRPVMDKWAPYIKKDKEARHLLQRWNIQSYRWVAPLLEPITEKEQTVLRDVYDAEIAYQDSRLARMFQYLESSGELDNTMVIVVADHGESHGEHDFMGHAFVNYDEAVHVPLFIHHPDMMPAGERVGHHVSGRRVFHTILEAAGVEHESYGYTASELSLTRAVEGPDKEPGDEVVVAEAYPPLNFITVMELNNPEAIERFRCRSLRRAVYNGNYKLLTIDEQPDEFFDLSADPLEENNLIDNPIYGNDVLTLEKKLSEFLVAAEAHRDGTAAGNLRDYSDNPELIDRLRALGYIE